MVSNRSTSIFKSVDRWMDGEREQEYTIISRWAQVDDTDVCAECVLGVESVYPLNSSLNGVSGDYHAWKLAQQTPAALAKYRVEQNNRDHDYRAMSNCEVWDRLDEIIYTSRAGNAA